MALDHKFTFDGTLTGYAQNDVVTAERSTTFPFDGALTETTDKYTGDNQPNQYLVELTIYYSSAEVTKYYSTHGCTVGTQYYEPRLINPGSLKNMLYSDGTTSGSSTIGYGEVSLANPDGGLDFLLDAGFAGRSILIKQLIAGTALTLMSCSMEQPTFDANTVNIRIKDAKMALNIPVQPNKYGGTNTLPDGIDGTDDIKGKPKPLLHGRPPNITPVCVNTSRLIYQIHDGAVYAITAVYDKGVALTAGVDRATNALLQANPPAAGTYDTCLAEGLFRLGSSPFGAVTVDVTSSAVGSNMTTAQGIMFLHGAAGPTVGVDATSITALDTANSSVIEFYLTEERTLAECIDEMLAGVGGWATIVDGDIVVGRLDAPTGTAVATLTNTEILSMDRIATNDASRGVPAWKVTANYDKNYTIQDAGSLAGRVTFGWKLTSLPSPTPSSQWWKNVAYGNGLFVAVGTASKTVGLSTDGITWTNYTHATIVFSEHITYGNGLFVVVTGAGTFATSPDGSNWTSRTLPVSGSWTSLVYGEDKFVAISANGPGFDPSVTVYSSNGVDWTQGAMPSRANWITITYGGGLYVALVQSATGYATSTNGITWTAQTNTELGTWWSLTYGKGLFVAVSSNGTACMVSSNGTSWKATTMPSDSWLKIKYGADTFVAVDPHGSVAISYDGSTWVLDTLITTGTTNGLAYGNGVFVALGSNNTNAYYMRMSPETKHADFISKQYRTISATDGNVKTIYPNASEITINSLFVDVGDAADEADRLLTLHSVRRDYISIKTKRSAITMPKVSEVVDVYYNRYGYTSGRKMVCLGYEIDYATDELILFLWG